MKKSIFCLFIAFIITALILPPVSAQKVTEGYYTYTVTDGQATITNFDRTVSGDIVIPSILGGYPVVSIGEDAFNGCNSLTDITIPDGVTSIGFSAFAGCRSLTSIVIPNGVTSIDNNTFGVCSSLASVTIPNTVTSIGGAAFQACISLTSITIPDSVTSIGHGVFGGCTGLTSVTIPNGLTSIENNLFAGCSSLTSITIPDSITSIGEYSFSGCISLISVTIPSSVDNIGTDAFYACPNLTVINVDSDNQHFSSDDSVLLNKTKTTLIYFPQGKGGGYAIPNSVTDIGDAAFNTCRNLTSIIIPSSVKSIGKEAFYGCSGLTSLTIPRSVKSIGKEAFYGCSGLISLTIPRGVTSIEQDAFYNCHSLESVNVDSENQYYLSDGGVLFSKDKTLLIYCPQGRGGGYAIPNSVTSIGDTAFNGCSRLTSITIPDSVVSLGENAFRACSGLISVTLPSSITSISKGTFNWCISLKSIAIPSSVRSIKENAFYACPDLSTVYYTGTKQEWESMLVESLYNDQLLNANIIYNSYPPLYGEVGAQVTDMIYRDGELRTTISLGTFELERYVIIAVYSSDKKLLTARLENVTSDMWELTVNIPLDMFFYDYKADTFIGSTYGIFRL